MNFTAIDVETANQDVSSICQIGMAVVRDSQIKEVITEIIDPEDFFHPVNVGIHGITERAVRGRPNFKAFFPTLCHTFESHPVISHTFFDRAAITQACQRCGCLSAQNPWLDSALIARRSWPDQFGSSGYGLKNIAESFGIEFRHHDAGEDARVAAEIVLRASQTGNFDLSAWAANGPPSRSRMNYAPPVKLEGNPDGPLYGLQLVFTGQLSIPRAEAAKVAADLGVFVHPSVTKKTSLVVVGDQDVRHPDWGDKSIKQRKAEELIAQGYDILILSESDFHALVQAYSERG